jgi:hypothetical protein
MRALVHCDRHFLAFALQSITRCTYDYKLSQFCEIWRSNGRDCEEHRVLRYESVLWDKLIEVSEEHIASIFMVED